MKERRDIGALTQKTALALLRAGDRQTHTFTTARDKSGTSETKEGSPPSLVITVRLKNDESDMQQLDAFLADLGVSREAIVAVIPKGFITTLTRNKGGVEFLIPLEPIERMAGMSWDAANPAVRRMQKDANGRA